MRIHYNKYIVISIFIIIIVYCLFYKTDPVEGFDTNHYITGKLGNGLGNRIFIMLAVKGFAEKTNKVPVFSLDSMESNPHEEFDETFDAMKEIFPEFQVIKDSKWKDISEAKEFHYEDNLLKNSENDDIRLHGIFQHPKYFPSKMPTLQKNILKNTAFIHIRLGDYENTVHDVGLKDYYKKCIHWFKKNSPTTNFLILSNNPEKAEAQVKEYSITYRMSKAKKAIDVLKEMASCTGGICSNSSLSYLGAQFQDTNRGTVFMPSTWILNKEIPNDFYPSWATVI